MAGPYAHLSEVTGLINSLDRLSALPVARQAMLAKHSDYVELGAVCPDFPLFDKRGSLGTSIWGYVMHYSRPADFVRHAVGWIDEHRSETDGLSLQRTEAWLFGYAAHLTTDLTIHPVIERIVGPYAQNAEQHVLCELHQDAFIFHHTTRELIGRANYMAERNAGIGNLYQKMPPFLKECWEASLAHIGHDYPGVDGDIDVSLWCQSSTMLVSLAEKTARLPGFGDFMGYRGLAYPTTLEAIDLRFVRNLPRPGEASSETIDYLDAFQKAGEHIVDQWTQLDSALAESSPVRFGLPNGNLDTGLADADQRLIFWE